LPLHDSAELLEVLVGRVPKIDRYMDVGHAEPAHAPRLVRQGFLVGVEPKVDDVLDAESADFGELRLCRLTRRGDPIIKPTPVVSGFRIGHQTLASGEEEPGGERG